MIFPSVYSASTLPNLFRRCCCISTSNLAAAFSLAEASLLSLLFVIPAYLARSLGNAPFSSASLCEFLRVTSCCLTNMEMSKDWVPRFHHKADPTGTSPTKHFVSPQFSWSPLLWIIQILYLFRLSAYLVCPLSPSLLSAAFAGVRNIGSFMVITYKVSPASRSAEIKHGIRTFFSVSNKRGI